MKEDPETRPKNDDLNERDPNVDLEVRIVALVLGEASPGEREELERIIKRRTDLQAFRQEIEGVHGILTDVGDGERQLDSINDDWKLPIDRRATVEARLASKHSPDVSINRSRWWNQGTLRSLAKISAVICLAGFFGQLLLPMQKSSSLSVARMSGRLADQAVSSTREPAVPKLFVESDLAEMQSPVAETMGVFEGFGFEVDAGWLRALPSAPANESPGQSALKANKSRRLQAGMGMEADMEMGMGMGMEMGIDMGMDDYSGMGMADGIASSGPVPRSEILGDFAFSPIPKRQLGRLSGIASSAPIDGKRYSTDRAESKPVATPQFGGASQLAEAGAALETFQRAKKKSSAAKRDAPSQSGYAFYMKIPESKRASGLDEKPPVGLDEKSAAEDAFSTFSLHVGDVAFQLARSSLSRGSWPEPAKIRIEEFVNALDYGDPLPSQTERVACQVEQAVHPFVQQRNLLRVSMRTAATGRASTTPLRLTFLLDNSGSMERFDRQETVRRAFALLAGQLQAMDQVTLISFARQPRLLADQVNGAKSAELVQLIDNLPSEGGTNLESALQLALEKAREQQIPTAQNRIILLTDGAVNLGNANPASLSRLIETMRSQGIAFDAAGIGADGLNDEILEALTRRGDGRYYLLDSVEVADDGFARQIAGALRPAAMNVKVQVEFNPERVGQYKLLGFEKHRLAKEDFRNDKVDAAELAAAEAGVAVYQFEAKPDGEGDVGSVSVRFRDVSTGQMVEDRWPIPYEANALRLDESPPSIRMAATAALFAAKLRGDSLGQLVDLQSLARFLADLPDQGEASQRIRQLQQMIQQARQLQGE